MADDWAHNPEVEGSNPSSATRYFTPTRRGFGPVLAALKSRTRKPFESGRVNKEAAGPENGPQS